MKSRTFVRILLLSGLLLSIILYVLQVRWFDLWVLVLLTGYLLYLNERDSEKGRDSPERSGDAGDQSDPT
jgi:hypothetical protein